MKSEIFFLLFLGGVLHSHGPVCSAEYYRWVDDKGVMHFTDNLHNIPQKQRSKAARIKAKESPKSVAADQPNPTGKASIPIEKRGNVVIVEAKLNDNKSGKFVVDTGASFTIISTAMARELNLDLKQDPRTASLQTANGRIEAPVAKLDSVRVGGLEVTDLTAAVHDAIPDSQVSGLLGLNFLRNFRIDIDTQKGLLHLERK